MLQTTEKLLQLMVITGEHEEAQVDFSFSMKVTRILESPRVTLPYTEEQWNAIAKAGHEVVRRLQAGDVRLSMGGEPTFVSIDDVNGAEWNTDAVGPTKRRYAENLIRRLRDKFAPGGLLHICLALTERLPVHWTNRRADCCGRSGAKQGHGDRQRCASA